MPSQKLPVPNIILWCLCGLYMIAGPHVMEEKDSSSSPRKLSEGKE